MTAPLRLLPAFAASCLLSALAGCSSGSAPAVSPASPVVSAPAAKPKFAYTGNQGASLSGYSVDPSTGALAPLSGFPFAVGVNPDIVTHDPQNRFLVVADASASMLHVFAIDSTTGALAEIAPSPYNTMIEPWNMVIDPSGTHLYLYRTGANDAYPGVTGNQIVAYNISSTGVLTPVAGAPSLTSSTEYLSAPGMAIDAAGKFLYLQEPHHLYTFSIDSASGSLTLLQTVSSGNGGALVGGIALDPAGAYLYALGTNSLLSYAIDSASGVLTLTKSSPMAELDGAYTLALSPNGAFAYTIENNNDLVSYAVSGGAFTPVGTTYSGVYGLQIAVDPSGSFLYVPQGCENCPVGASNIVHQFAIGASGALTPLSAPTVASGVTPVGITVTSQ